jgi:type I restriction enzyme M protein
MVLRKGKSENSTLFIDASREFVKVTNSNKLTKENIEKILAAYKDRKNVDHFVRLVPNSSIAEQDYNLSVSTYVEAEDKSEIVDIKRLNVDIDLIVAHQQKLRTQINNVIKGL